MTKIIAFLLLVLSGQIFVFSQPTEKLEILDYVTRNIPEMRENYREYFGEKWDVSTCEEIIDIYDLSGIHLGYTVIFDKGYLSFGKDSAFLDMSIDSYPRIPLKYHETPNSKLYYFAKQYFISTNNGFLQYDGSVFISAWYY